MLDLERTGRVAVAGAVAGRPVHRAAHPGRRAGGRRVPGRPAPVRASTAATARWPRCRAAALRGGGGRRRRRRGWSDCCELLHAEVGRRQRRPRRGRGHAGLGRAAAARPDDPLPYLVLLLDRLEGFLGPLRRARRRPAGGPGASRCCAPGPAVGVTMVLSTDRTGFPHRISLGGRGPARCCARPLSDDAAAFGLDPRRLPRRMPPGRGIWADHRRGGAGRAARPRSGRRRSGRRGEPARRRPCAARWDGRPRAAAAPARPAARRHHGRAEARAGSARPAGPAVVHPGRRRRPPRRRSTWTSPTAARSWSPGRPGPGDRPRWSRSRRASRAGDGSTGARRGAAAVPAARPGREPGCWVLAGEPADIASGRGRRRTGWCRRGRRRELLADLALTDALEVFARSARDRGAVLVAAATTEDLLANPYRGWLATLRRARTGLLLNPASHVDGEVFGLRLPRSVRRWAAAGTRAARRAGGAGRSRSVQPATGGA